MGGGGRNIAWKSKSAISEDRNIEIRICFNNISKNEVLKHNFKIVCFQGLCCLAVRSIMHFIVQPYLLLDLQIYNSKDFWLWCIAVGKIRFLDFVNRLLFLKNTTLRKVDLVSSSGKMMWATTLLDPLERANFNSIIFPENGNRPSFGNVFFRNNGRQSQIVYFSKYVVYNSKI